MFSGNRSIRQALLSCDVLDMSNSGKLYQKVPLWLFRGIQKLSLAGTTVSSKNFPRLATEAQKLRTLDIENCRNISEEAILNAKYKLQSFRSVNISDNSQFGVLTTACLLSYESVIDICCRGKKLSGKELLFLSKTFPSLPGIGLRLDGISKDYFWDFSHFSQTCEFRSSEAKPTIAFFAAVNHLNGPLGKQNSTSRAQKVMVCDLWISIRFVFLCFKVRCL